MKSMSNMQLSICNIRISIWIISHYDMLFSYAYVCNVDVVRYVLVFECKISGLMNF